MYVTFKQYLGLEGWYNRHTTVHCGYSMRVAFNASSCCFITPHSSHRHLFLYPFLTFLAHTQYHHHLFQSYHNITVKLMPSLPFGEIIIHDAWHGTMGTHKDGTFCPRPVNHSDLLFTSSCYVLGCIERLICLV